MAIVEGNQQTQNPGSARFPGPGEMVVQRKRFKLAVYGAADAEYDDGFDVHMDEMSVVETASVSIEKELGAAAVNYRAVVEKIQENANGDEDKNCVVVGVHKVSDGIELDTVNLNGFYFVVEAEGV